MNLIKIGNLVTSKFVGTGPSSYKKRIYRAAVSQRLRNIFLKHTTGMSRLKEKNIFNFFCFLLDHNYVMLRHIEVVCYGVM